MSRWDLCTAYNGAHMTVEPWFLPVAATVSLIIALFICVHFWLSCSTVDVSQRTLRECVHSITVTVKARSLVCYPFFVVELISRYTVFVPLASHPIVLQSLWKKI